VELKSSQKNPQELAFSPDGSSLAVGWLEEGLEVWSLETHTLLAGPIKVPGGTAWLAWSPDGRVLMHGIPQGGVLYFFEPRGGAHVGTYNPKMGGIARGVFRRDGTQILVCSNHREAKRFDVRIDPPTDKVVSESPAAPPPAKAPFDVPQARAHQQAWAKHLGTTVQTANSIGGKLALIPPGEFLMGTSDAEIEKLLEAGAKKGVLRGHLDRIRDLEGPQHRVVLTRPFWMATTETTGGQFRKFIESSGYVTEAEKYGFGNSSLKVANDTVTPEMRTLSWKSRGTPDDSPVGEVTWNDAVAFCNWLSVQEKRQACYRPEPKTAAGWALVPGADGYRLPTEAEWEFACRAGTTWWYFFGDELKTLEGYASLAANRPVGSKLPNGFGLYDLYGSVWEMCQDFDGRSYADSPLEDPTGVSTGTARIIRGGAANSTPLHLRSAYRGTMHQSYRNSAYGFRYVRGVAADEAAR
jgi:formylglycine-generating enzyme